MVESVRRRRREWPIYAGDAPIPDALIDRILAVPVKTSRALVARMIQIPSVARMIQIPSVPSFIRWNKTSAADGAISEGLGAC